MFEINEGRKISNDFIYGVQEVCVWLEVAGGRLWQIEKRKMI